MQDWLQTYSYSLTIECPKITQAGLTWCKVYQPSSSIGQMSTTDRAERTRYSILRVIPRHPDTGPSLYPRVKTMVPMSGCWVIQPVFLFVPARCLVVPAVQYSEEVTWCPCLILSPVSAHAFCLGSVYMVTSDRNIIIFVLSAHSNTVASLGLCCYHWWWSGWNKQIISFNQLASILISVSLMRAGPGRTCRLCVYWPPPTPGNQSS